MEQYIPKSALVAEMNKLNNISLEYGYTTEQRIVADVGKDLTLKGLLNYTDTLEVKEADLEKHLKEDIEDVFFDLDGVAVKGATHYLTVEDVKDIAKHFFELGIKVTQKGERV